MVKIFNTLQNLVRTKIYHQYRYEIWTYNLDKSNHKQQRIYYVLSYYM